MANSVKISYDNKLVTEIEAPGGTVVLLTKDELMESNVVVEYAGDIYDGGFYEEDNSGQGD